MGSLAASNCPLLDRACLWKLQDWRIDSNFERVCTRASVGAFVPRTRKSSHIKDHKHDKFRFGVLGASGYTGFEHSIVNSGMSCSMKMAAGHSDEPGKLSIDHIVQKALKVWDSAPQPVKSFPWNTTVDNFIQLILDLFMAVFKYLSVPVFFVTSVSELSYCAHERKLYLTILPFLIGVAVAGVLRAAAMEASPSLRNSEVPWHLIAIAGFFTLLKLPGPYYPYWGRILIPHFANGALVRTLWFAFQWHRKFKNPSETAVVNDSGFGLGL